MDFSAELHIFLLINTLVWPEGQHVKQVNNNMKWADAQFEENTP